MVVGTAVLAAAVGAAVSALVTTPPFAAVVAAAVLPTMPLVTPVAPVTTVRPAPVSLIATGVASELIEELTVICGFA